MKIDNVQLTDETARIFEGATSIAKHYSEIYAYFWVGTGHVLAAMLTDSEENSAKKFLVGKGIDPTDIVDEVEMRVEEYAMSGIKEDGSVKAAEDGRMSDTLREMVQIAAGYATPLTAEALLRAFLARTGLFCTAAQILADGTSLIDDVRFEMLRM